MSVRCVQYFKNVTPPGLIWMNGSTLNGRMNDKSRIDQAEKTYQSSIVTLVAPPLFLSPVSLAVVSQLDWACATRAVFAESCLCYSVCIWAACPCPPQYSLLDSIQCVQFKLVLANWQFEVVWYALLATCRHTWCITCKNQTLGVFELVASVRFRAETYWAQGRKVSGDTKSKYRY